ncbi:hypothetical protein Axy10_043 [Achromobacter phage vB_AxyP_19-32_Axy10]|uniref:Uncharacterized protein n=1 Tax=Achromobacter phage vB_AxyP_19-32_Axy10 TaxID=2591041 RepID=A0A514CTY9_9CAUD|nr:hypothetical protein KMC59_gp75 [Achromobacter phage vB_AxyP_19-32_Axy10]QDH83944.1 hypothetical protein Axy10_043 [Achromobacter phage vB_AxyP_19-32_Axy10]
MEKIMAKVYRVNRKAKDEDILRMNYVGMSLGTIARTLGVHPTTVTLRLQNLNVEPADTRRTFMEHVLKPLPVHIADWLADQLGPTYQIRQYVRDLIQEAYDKRFEKIGTAHERHLEKYGGVVPRSHPQPDAAEHQHADGLSLRGSEGNGGLPDAANQGSPGDPATSAGSTGQPGGADEA